MSLSRLEILRASISVVSRVTLRYVASRVLALRITPISVHIGLLLSSKPTLPQLPVLTMLPAAFLIARTPVPGGAIGPKKKPRICR